MSQEFSFKLSFDDFDVSLLADGDAGDFAARVSNFFVTQFQGFGGKARVIVNDQERVIEVVWTKESRWQEPKEKILNLLHAGKLTEALPMIWTLVQHDPNDADNLYHLGVVYSELRQYAKATAVLERLIEVAPRSCPRIDGVGRGRDRQRQPLDCRGVADQGIAGGANRIGGHCGTSVRA